MYPRLTDIRVWGRTIERAQAIADTSSFDLVVCDTAEAAVRGADIVTSATGAKSPIIMGEWIKRGAHVDLVGAHGPEMREGDDELISTASLFVDSREAVLEHIGELCIPIAEGVVKGSDVLGDLYELVGGDDFEKYRTETTVFKNGGGAHLDLMVANYLYEQVLK
jgi:ornithine cyclodeaminase